MLQSQRGLVWMFPGIEGGPWALKPAYRALRDVGVEAEIRIHDWARPFGAIDNLTNLEENLRRAARIADTIDGYHAQRPHAPIDLIGYSGGGGLAVLVAEALAPETRIRNIVLAQAALSPQYDLSPAISRLHGELVNFYCPSDWFVLGLGTSVFGTIDRDTGVAAGRVGFDEPLAASAPAHRAKLRQICWEPEMSRQGHLGTHTGILSYAWNRRYVAPLLAPPAACQDQSAKLAR
jgi:pimeloyl-ACP methyl ester carboxylesterase